MFLSIEIAATIFGAIGVWLTVKKNIYCWPFHLASTLLAIFVYYNATLYAEMFLQGFYIYMGINGWLSWKKSRLKKDEIEVDKMPVAYWIRLILIFGTATLIIGGAFYQYTDNELPFVDSAITVASILATWMMVNRFLENWLAWIVIDSICIGVYAYKGIYWFSLLFLVFTLLAIKGYFDWKKSLKEV